MYYCHTRHTTRENGPLDRTSLERPPSPGLTLVTRHYCEKFLGPPFRPFDLGYKPPVALLQLYSVCSCRPPPAKLFTWGQSGQVKSGETTALFESEDVFPILDAVEETT